MPRITHSWMFHRLYNSINGHLEKPDPQATQIHTAGRERRTRGEMEEEPGQHELIVL